MREGTRRALGVAVSVWLVAQLGGGSALGGAAIGGGTVSGGAAVGRGAPVGGVPPVGGASGGGPQGAGSFGGTTTYGGPTLGPRPLDQLDRAVRQPMPPLPQPGAPSRDAVWVPDRYIDRAGGTFHVPGHWERRINPQEHYVPPLSVCARGGECVSIPAGVRPPPEMRQGP